MCIYVIRMHVVVVAVVLSSRFEQQKLIENIRVRFMCHCYVDIDLLVDFYASLEMFHK